MTLLTLFLVLGTILVAAVVAAAWQYWPVTLLVVVFLMVAAYLRWVAPWLAGRRA